MHRLPSIREREAQERQQQIAEQLVLKAAQAAEKALDEQIDKLDNIDDDELSSLRAKRLQQIKAKDQQRKNWRQQGHGQLTVCDDQTAFFEDVKRSKKMVVHFYRSGARFCDVVNEHLRKLAAKHEETKFVCIDAEKAPFLVEHLKIWMLPTITLIKDGKTEHSIVGLDELGSNGKFRTETLERRLADYDVIELDEDARHS